MHQHRRFSHYSLEGNQRIDRWESWAFNAVLGSNHQDRDYNLALYVLCLIDLNDRVSKERYSTFMPDGDRLSLNERSKAGSLNGIIGNPGFEREPPTVNRYEPATDRHSNEPLRELVYGLARIKAQSAPFIEKRTTFLDQINERGRVNTLWMRFPMQEPLRPKSEEIPVVLRTASFS